jgi:ribosomal protein S4E
VLLDSILEADKRFLKNDAGRRSVFVILTTDAGETMSDQSLGPFNRFVKDFVKRGGRAHAIIVGGRNRGVTSEIVENFVDNTNGFRDTVVIANALPKLMETVAAYVAADQ